MAIKLGISEWGQPAANSLKALATVMTLLAAFVALFITPMPEQWLHSDIKTYIMAVLSGLAGFSEILKRMSGDTNRDGYDFDKGEANKP